MGQIRKYFSIVWRPVLIALNIMSLNVIFPIFRVFSIINTNVFLIVAVYTVAHETYSLGSIIYKMY